MITLITVSTPPPPSALTSSLCCTLLNPNTHDVYSILIGLAGHCEAGGVTFKKIPESDQHDLKNYKKGYNDLLLDYLE